MPADEAIAKRWLTHERRGDDAKAKRRYVPPAVRAKFRREESHQPEALGQAQVCLALLRMALLGSTSSTPGLQGQQASGGVNAVAIAVPVAIVVLLVAAALAAWLLWRVSKKRQLRSQDTLLFEQLDSHATPRGKMDPEPTTSHHSMKNVMVASSHEATSVSGLI